MTLQVTRLCKPAVLSGSSSLPATKTKFETVLPVYTAKSVSSVLPWVMSVSPPEDGAVQVHQTDFPPTSSTWNGSPGSLVAPTLEPGTLLMWVPLRVIRSAKLSLGGR